MWNFILPFLGMGMGALQGALGNKGQKQIQQSKQNTYNNYTNDTWNNQNSYSKSMPVYDDQTWQAKNVLYDKVGSRLNIPLSDPNALARSQVNQNIWNIGGTAGLQQKLMQQQLASRGINYGAMGDAPRQAMDAGRISQLIQARNQLPGLTRQYEMENEQLAQGRLGQMMQLFAMTPKGTESEQSTSGHQYSSGESRGESQGWNQSTIPGNPWLGALQGGVQGLGEGLARYYGNRAGGGGGWSGRGLPDNYYPAMNPYTNRSISPWLNPYYGQPSGDGGWGF